ncbi:MAG: hypothetical protein U0792_10825 [Gemmataceae bacterium]
MLPSLLVAATLTAPGAPVPKDSVPNTTGPAPRIAAVKADQGGVWITANVYQKQKVQQQFWTNENGKQVLKTQEVEQMVSQYVHKQIGDFGGKFTTADGTPLSTEEATRRVRDGNTLLITADGKPVDKGWLKTVSGDTVVMIAEGLAEAYFVHGYGPYPMTAAPRLVMLSSDEKGEVRVPVNTNSNPNGQIYFNEGRAFRGRMVIQNGQMIEDLSYAAPAPGTSAGPDGKKALTEIKFDAYDVSGKLVSRTEALSHLKAGGLIILAGDNRFPDAAYLKAFRGDLLVIVSAELVFPQGQANPFDRPSAVKAPVKPPVNGLVPVAQPAIGIAVPAIKQVQIQKQVQKQVQIQVEK